MPPPEPCPTVPDGISTGDRFDAWAYRLTTLALAAILVAVAADGLSLVDVVGVDTATATAAAEGYELSVTAATVTRPALATPFEIVVRRAGGFDEPVEVAVEQDYLLLFDFGRTYPEPSDERTAGAFTVFEFDPPDGDELVVSFDWRLEPGVQSGAAVTVAVVEEERHVVEVTSQMRVWP